MHRGPPVPTKAPASRRPSQARNTAASITSKASIVAAGATTAAASAGSDDDRGRNEFCQPARRRGGEHGPCLLEPLGGARGDRLAAVAQHEAVETLGAGEAKAPRARRILLDQTQDPARRGAARGDHEIELVIDRERQHAGGGGFDQAFVVERAQRARRAVERLERHAERVAERAQIGFLVQLAGGDQHAVGADCRARPLCARRRRSRRPRAARGRSRFPGSARLGCAAVGEFSRPRDRSRDCRRARQKIPSSGRQPLRPELQPPYPTRQRTYRRMLARIQPNRESEL